MRPGRPPREYVGLLLVVSVVIATIASSGIDRQISDAIRGRVCAVTEGACAGAANSPGGAPTGRTSDRGQGRATEFARAAGVVAGIVDPGSSAPVASTTTSTPLAAALERERLQGLPPITVGLTDRQERILLCRRAAARADGGPIPTPTSLDRNADGIDDVASSDDQQSEGDAGDRFAGEACGLLGSIGLRKLGCNLGGDKATKGFQQGKALGGQAAIILPTPGGKIGAIAKLRKLATSAKAARRARTGAPIFDKPAKPPRDPLGRSTKLSRLCPAGDKPTSVRCHRSRNSRRCTTSSRGAVERSTPRATPGRKS